MRLPWQKAPKELFHGMKSLFLQNEEGQIDSVYSISAGLDYPGIGPEHAHFTPANVLNT